MNAQIQTSKARMSSKLYKKNNKLEVINYYFKKQSKPVPVNKSSTIKEIDDVIVMNNIDIKEIYNEYYNELEKIRQEKWKSLTDIEKEYYYNILLDKEFPKDYLEKSNERTTRWNNEILYLADLWESKAISEYGKDKVERIDGGTVIICGKQHFAGNILDLLTEQELEQMKKELIEIQKNYNKICYKDSRLSPHIDKLIKKSEQKKQAVNKPKTKKLQKRVVEFIDLGNDEVELVFEKSS